VAVVAGDPHPLGARRLPAHLLLLPLVLLANATLLSLYTLSCHSCRHVCGGGLDRFSKAPTRYALWKRISVLNQRHPHIAWVSLFGVALSDLYVRLVAMGTIHDLRLF